MIKEGTGGTATGDGLAQCLIEVGKTDFSAIYKAARICKSGSTNPSADLDQGVSTHCYASDIANRLTGWVRYPHKYTLDGALPAEVSRLSMPAREFYGEPVEFPWTSQRPPFFIDNLGHALVGFGVDASM